MRVVEPLQATIYLLFNLFLFYSSFYFGSHPEGRISPAGAKVDLPLRYVNDIFSKFQIVFDDVDVLTFTVYPFIKLFCNDFPDMTSGVFIWKNVNRFLLSKLIFTFFDEAREEMRGFTYEDCEDSFSTWPDCHDAVCRFTYLVVAEERDVEGGGEEHLGCERGELHVVQD
jgi:hypothetical protein